MAELSPAPFANLIHRIFKEFYREKKIFDLPLRSFYRASSDFSTRVSFLGRPAETPVGPAAGPHSQLAQNIVLSWLSGARIIELKTIQINDRLNIPRPCIDVRNVGYNVEWSQELRLEDSLQEYVAAWMLIHMIRASGIMEAFGVGEETIFDLSVGYDLKGIQTPQVSGYIRTLQDATPIIEKLRRQIPDEYRRFRELDYEPGIVQSVTLSTFHGCPAHEIEGIVDYLMNEFHLHVVIKMNPTLLGFDRVSEILHDTLGYTEIQLDASAFENDLSFDPALEMVNRLSKIAQKMGVHLGVKFSNTLVVKNHDVYFSDSIMYLSGAPLHVITLNLVEKFRKAMGTRIPISFSAGIDQKNFPNAVAMGFTPITVCTDLLRPGGYARLPKYLYHLHEQMRSLSVFCIEDFIVNARGHGALAVQNITNQTQEKFASHHAIASYLESLKNELILDLSGHLKSLKSDVSKRIQPILDLLPESAPVDARHALEGFYEAVVTEAARLNTPDIVAETTIDPRYCAQANRKTPKKIGSKLLFFDCINCDKCIPVCPNNANFAYEIEAVPRPYVLLTLTSEGVKENEGGIFQIEKQHQLANFADFCNECGNCDTFCPEDGGPYIVKPQFFGSCSSWETFKDRPGFFVTRQDHPKGDTYQMWARFNGKSYTLLIHREEEIALLSDGVLFAKIKTSDHSILAIHVIDSTQIGHTMTLAHYHAMMALLEGIFNAQTNNYVNSCPKLYKTIHLNL